MSDDTGEFPPTDIALDFTTNAPDGVYRNVRLDRVTVTQRSDTGRQHVRLTLAPDDRARRAGFTWPDGAMIIAVLVLEALMFVEIVVWAVTR